MQVPPDLEPFYQWYKAIGYEETRIRWTLFYLNLLKAMAPKKWPYAEPAGGSFNTEFQLPSADDDDNPPQFNYSIDKIKWVLRQLDNQPGNVLYAVKDPILMEWQEESTPLEKLSLIVTQMYEYPYFVSSQERPDFDALLKSAKLPKLGQILLMAVNPDPSIPIIAPKVFEVPSHLVRSPTQSVSLEDVIKIAYYNRIPYLDRLQNSLSVPNTLHLISRFLLNIVHDKSSVIKQGYAWNTAISSDQRWQQVAPLINDSSIFESYSDLVHLFLAIFKALGYQEIWIFRETEKYLSKVATQIPPPNDSNIRWLHTQIKSPWAGILWTGFDSWEYHLSEAEPKRFVTLQNLKAFYSVGAQWYRFEPQLQLYLYPEQTDVITQFYDRYGESINALQELAISYQQWLNRMTPAAPSSRESIQDNFKAMSNICNLFGNRLSSVDNLNRLRQPLVELEQTAIIDNVPLSVLLENQIIQVPSGSSTDALFNHSSMLRQQNGLLHSSRWWFDVLVNWWDSLCQDVLGAQLGMIVESDLPKDVVSREEQINSAVAEALIHSAQTSGGSSRKRQAGINRLHQAGTSFTKQMITQAKQRFNSILSTSDAMNQIDMLDNQVKLGLLPPSIARIELDDIVRKYQ